MVFFIGELGRAEAEKQPLLRLFFNKRRSFLGDITSVSEAIEPKKTSDRSDLANEMSL